MTIFLSASAIKDFLSCSYKYKYRRFAKVKSVETTAMRIGSAVHNVLEHCWDSESVGTGLYLDALVTEWNLSAVEKKRIQECLDVFYNKTSFPFSNLDKVEYNFKVPYNKDVFIVGKFDRVLEESVVIDWKTGKLPIIPSRDIQMIVYDWAFFKLYGHRASSIIDISLLDGRSVRYNRVLENEELLMKVIVPHILERIESGSYFPEGRFAFASTCKNCTFLGHCNHELDSRNNTKR